MADFRSVQTRMWREDEWFQGLAPDARLFWIYLFTNPSASVAGIYRLPIRTMSFESGLSEEHATELLAYFSRCNKAHYENGVVWVVKMRENQLPGKISTQLKTRLSKDIACIPDCPLKRKYLTHYGYSIDTVSIPVATDTDTDTDTDTEGVSPSEPKPAKKVKPAAPPTNGHTEPTEQQAMFGAVAEVCQRDMKLQAKRIGQTASKLLAAGYTPEQVQAFGPWWYAHDWRGKKDQSPPTLGQLEESMYRATHDFEPPEEPPFAAEVY